MIFMETKEKKWRWINCAFYLDEPFYENEIKEALQNECVRNDIFKLIQFLQKIENNNT